MVTSSEEHIISLFLVCVHFQESNCLLVYSWCWRSPRQGQRT